MGREYKNTIFSIATIVAAIIISHLYAFTAKGQISTGFPVTLDSSRSSPSPYETFTITAGTPLFDQARAFFSWTVNGKQFPESSGIGKNKISLTAGEVGSLIRVRADVSSPQGDEVSVSKTLLVSDLILTWFAETYTPKWYKGKALPTQKSSVVVAAVPNIIINGARLPKESLTFRWDVDSKGSVLYGAGEDKLSIRMSNTPSSSKAVHLTVEGLNLRFYKKATTLIRMTYPQASIYFYSPLGGIETRSVPKLLTTARNKLIDLIAEPFFFPLQSKKELSFGWKVEEAKLGGATERPDLLTINTGEYREDEILVGVDVDDADPTTPRASKPLSISLK